MESDETTDYGWARDSDIEDTLRQVYPLLADTYVDVHRMMSSHKPLNLAIFVAHGIREIMRGLVNELLADDPLDIVGAKSDGSRFAEMVKRADATTMKQAESNTLEDDAVAPVTKINADRASSVENEARIQVRPTHTAQKGNHQSKSCKCKKKGDDNRVRVERMFRRVSGVTDPVKIKRYVDAWMTLNQEEVNRDVHIRPSYQSDTAQQFDQICEWIRTLHELIGELSLREYVANNFFQNLEKTDEFLKKTNP